MPWYTKALESLVDKLGLADKPAPSLVEVRRPAPKPAGTKPAPPKQRLPFKPARLVETKSPRPAPKTAANVWGAAKPAPKPPDKRSPVRKRVEEFMKPKPIPLTKQDLGWAARDLQRKLESTLPPVQGPKSLSDDDVAARLVHPLYRAVKESMGAGIGLVPPVYGAMTNPVGTAVQYAHLPEKFGADLEKMSKAMRPFNVFNMPGSYIAASIEEGKLADPLDEWERQLYPHLAGQEHYLSTTLGRKTEEATGSKIAGQAAATVGWAADIALSSDNIVASLFSKGAFVTRQAARKGAARAVRYAAVDAAKDVGIDTITARKIARNVTTAVHGALPITADAAPEAAASAGRDIGIASRPAPFEPKDLGWGLPRAVDQWRTVVRTAIREQHPSISDDGLQVMTDKIVARLQHQWGPNAWRFRGERMTKAPDAPVFDLLREQDLARAEKQLARVAKSTSHVAREDPSTWEPIAEKLRDAEVGAIDTQIGDLDHQIRLHTDSIPELAGQQKAETNDFRYVVRQQTRQMDAAARRTAQAEAAVVAAQEQLRQVDSPDTRAAVETAMVELTAAREAQKTATAPALSPEILRPDIPDLTNITEMTDTEVRRVERQLQSRLKQIVAPIDELYKELFHRYRRESGGSATTARRWLREHNLVRNGRGLNPVEELSGASRRASLGRKTRLELVPESNGFTYDQILKDPSKAQWTAQHIADKYKGLIVTADKNAAALAAFYGADSEGMGALVDVLMRSQIDSDIGQAEILAVQRKYHIDDRAVEALSEEWGTGITSLTSPDWEQSFPQKEGTQQQEAYEDGLGQALTDIMRAKEARDIEREAGVNLRQIERRIVDLNEDLADLPDLKQAAIDEALADPGIQALPPEVQKQHIEYLEQWAKERELDIRTEMKDLEDDIARIHADWDAMAVEEAKPKRRPQRTREQIERSVRNLAWRIERGVELLLEEAQVNPAWAERILDGHALGTLKEDMAWEKILAESTRRKGDLDHALAVLERSTANAAELQEGRARIIRDATTNEIQARVLRNLRKEAARQVGRSVPRSVRGDAEELIASLREAWHGPGELPPGVERVVRNRAIATLRRKRRALEQARKEALKLPLAARMAALVRETEMNHALRLLKPGVRSNVGRLMNSIQPNNEVPADVANRARMIYDMAEESQNRRLAELGQKVYEGVDDHDAATMALALPIKTGWFNRKAAGHIPEGFRHDPDPENALQIIFSRLAAKGEGHEKYQGLRAADFMLKGLDGETPQVAVDKLPEEARTLWKRIVKAQALQDAFFNGSDEFPWNPSQRAIMDAIAEDMGEAPVGELGPGYMLFRAVARTEPHQLREMISGSLADTGSLRVGLTNAKEEIESADYATVMEALEKWTLKGRDPASISRLPIIDMREAQAQWSVRAYRNEIMYGLRNLVKEWGTDIRTISPSKRAALEAAGWVPPSWPGENGEAIVWKGMENYLVSPGMQATLARRNLESGLDWVLPRLIEGWMDKMKFPTLLSGLFGSAQIVEMFEDHLRALEFIGVRNMLRAQKYVGRIVANNIAELAATGDFPSAAKRLQGVIAKGTSAVYDAFAGKQLSPERFARYEKYANEYLARTRDIIASSAPGQLRASRRTLTSMQLPDFLRESRPAKRVGREIGEAWDAAATTWFIADQLSTVSLYVGLREAGESDETARQILNSIKVTYRASGSTPLDRFLQKIWWFSRYFTERTRQYTAEAARRPWIATSAFETARKAQKGDSIGTGTQMVMSGRPAWMKRDPSIMPLSYSLPGIDSLRPDNYPTMLEIDGPWIVYGRVRIPALEWAGDIEDAIFTPGEAFTDRVLPQYKFLWKLFGGSRPGKRLSNAVREMPVVGGYLRSRQRNKQAEPDDEFDRRPVPAEGVIQGARIGKGDYDRIMQMYPEDGLARVAQYEKEKTDFLKRIQSARARTLRPWGIALYPVFYDECVGNMTTDQLVNYARLYGYNPEVERVPLDVPANNLEEPGSYFVQWTPIPYSETDEPHIPLFKYDPTATEKRRNPISIEEELEKRARGEGPETIWDQLWKRY